MDKQKQLQQGTKIASDVKVWLRNRVYLCGLLSLSVDFVMDVIFVGYWAYLLRLQRWPILFLHVFPSFSVSTLMHFYVCLPDVDLSPWYTLKTVVCWTSRQWSLWWRTKNSQMLPSILGILAFAHHGTTAFRRVSSIALSWDTVTICVLTHMKNVNLCNEQY